MSLRLYYHPFSSFCQKVIVALYENDTQFERQIVDLGDEASRAGFLKVWPAGKFPVLRDDSRDLTIPESSVIIEYLALRYPGKVKLVPDDPELAWKTRLEDRFYDLHVQLPMQKIVGDRLRPADKKDAYGVEQARQQLATSLGIVEQGMRAKQWAMGDFFSMADCAAAPALFYANLVMPFGDAHKAVSAYLGRLLERPSFARAVKEAEPYMAVFPRP